VIAPPSPPAAAGAPRRFAPQPVRLAEFGAIAREAAGLLAASPGRLFGLFLLVYLPLQLLPDRMYLALPLRAMLASVGFAGFFCALDSVRHARPPTIQDMASVWRLPSGKLLLLVLGGLMPLLCVLAVWWLDLGGAEFDRLMSAPAAVQAADGTWSPNPAATPTLTLWIEFSATGSFAAMPLLFLQPLCALYPWSGSRTLSAALIAWAANWRWSLLLAAALTPVAIVLNAYEPAGLGQTLVLLLSDIALNMFLCAVTLVLLRRSLA
jgi:hypothetical protein